MHNFNEAHADARAYLGFFDRAHAIGNLLLVESAYRLACVEVETCDGTSEGAEQEAAVEKLHAELAKRWPILKAMQAEREALA